MSAWYNGRMFTTFAHAGHVHSMQDMTMAQSIDHCLPIIICAGIIIVILLAVIAYLLTTWQPKSSQKTKSSKKK